MSDVSSIKLPTPPSSPAREKTCWQCGKTFVTTRTTCPDDGAKLLDLVLKDRDLLVGQTIDKKYQIRECLAEGGMGKVYESYDLEAEREVAIKVLKADYLRDETIRKRFMHEARILANLEHPNVVSMYDFGQMPSGNFYMVMELLKGESLAERLARKFLSYREIFSIVTGVCDALAESHKRGVIHRDLKPENIFIVIDPESGEECAKLIDFGVARQAERQTLTQTGSLWGTPAYMSPEQCRGEQVSESGDLYAMGVIVYELVCGHLPFVANTQMGYAVKHMHVTPRAMKSAPGLQSPPDALDDLVIQTLGKTAEERPENMEAFLSAFRAIVDTYFADKSQLDNVPALEVDPEELKVWMKEGELEGEKEKPARAPQRSQLTYETEAVVDVRDALKQNNQKRSMMILALAGVLGVLIVISAVVWSMDRKSSEVKALPSTSSSASVGVVAEDPKQDAVLEKAEEPTPPEPVASADNDMGFGDSSASQAVGQGAMIAAHVTIVANQIASPMAITQTKPLTNKSKSSKRRKTTSTRRSSSRKSQKEKKEDVKDALKNTL